MARETDTQGVAARGGSWDPARRGGSWPFPTWVAPIQCPHVAWVQMLSPPRPAQHLLWVLCLRLLPVGPLNFSHIPLCPLGLGTPCTGV